MDETRSNFEGKTVGNFAIGEINGMSQIGLMYAATCLGCGSTTNIAHKHLRVGIVPTCSHNLGLRDGGEG
jgi:hypothetical protein